MMANTSGSVGNRRSARVIGARVALCGVAAVAALVLAGACAKPLAPPGVTPSSPVATGATASPTVKPSPKPTVDPMLVVTPKGVGPYLIGVTLASLQSKGQVVDLEDSPICPGVKFGRSTGKYAGKLRLVFGADGKLWHFETSDTTLQTTVGARVGMKIATIAGLYGAKATVYPQTGSALGGVLAEGSGGLAVVFLEGPDDRAASLIVGPTELLEAFATGNSEGC
jgi:hypothetical protein